MTDLRYRAVVGAMVFGILTPTCVQAAINAGDHLSVHVYNHPELSTVAIVDSAGSIQLPVVGTVHAAGLKSEEVAYTIRTRIKPYVPFPAVDVQDTSESQTLFVSGAPGGVFQYSPNETLAAAVAEITKATPFTDNSQSPPNSLINRYDLSRLDLKRVVVRRSGRTLGPFDMVALRGVGDPGPTLFANDTIAFSNKPISVTVVGAVNAPGAAYLWPDEPLADAVAQVGGASPAAASNHVQISRSDGTTQMVSFGDSVFNGPARAGDVVTVTTAPRVTVAGLVEKPGQVTLNSDFTLISALAAAGGYNKFGDLRKVQVIHKGVPTRYNIVALAHGDMAQNPVLHDGDTVYVPEGYKTDWSLVWAGLGSVGGLSGLYYNVIRR